MVTLSGEAVGLFERFSLYNSPFPAHDAGRAVDLYPGPGTDRAPSPVAGEVVETRRTRAPTRGGAERHDHLVVVDTGTRLARLLHVEPAVGVGDRVAVGTDLGRLVDSGYFAPWVDPHVHLGFRPAGGDAVRASGSLPLELGVSVRPVPWDGRATVVAREPRYAVLDAPGHPDPGSGYAGLAAGGADGAPGGALDGGLPHYEGGGLLPGGEGRVTLLGTTVGRASGRDVTWEAVTVTLDGAPARGLSLFCGRDACFVKVVEPTRAPPPGSTVRVRVRPKD